MHGVRPKQRILSIALVLCICGAIAPQAHAYLDPGTGSFIFQAAIAAALGAVVALKHYWQRVRGLFGSSTNRQQGPDSDE